MITPGVSLARLLRMSKISRAGCSPAALTSHPCSSALSPCPTRNFPTLPYVLLGYQPFLLHWHIRSAVFLFPLVRQKKMTFFSKSLCSFLNHRNTNFYSMSILWTWRRELQWKLKQSDNPQNIAKSLVICSFATACKLIIWGGWHHQEGRRLLGKSQTYLSSAGRLVSAWGRFCFPLF